MSTKHLFHPANRIGTKKERKAAGAGAIEAIPWNFYRVKDQLLEQFGGLAEKNLLAMSDCLIICINMCSINSFVTLTNL